jgi:microtubule-associated protein-like 6
MGTAGQKPAIEQSVATVDAVPEEKGDSTLDSNDYIKAKDPKKDKMRAENAHEGSAKKANNKNELFSEVKVENGDQFMAIKPWLGAIKAPSNFTKPALNQNKPPQVNLDLNYVFGYRAKDMRNNVRYLKNGNIVYNAAALGIVLDINTNEQKFFNLHIDDITALAVHPDEVTVATGEIGPHPAIYIWSTNTMQAMFTLKGCLQKGIVNLGFSKSGDKLVAVAVDVDHMVAVYDTKIGALLGSAKGDAALIVDIKFKSDTEFVSVGPKHYKFWTINNKNLASQKGNFGANCNMVSCVAFNNDDVIVGAADGSVQFWKGPACGKAFKMHSKAVDALYVNAEYVITGGKDCIVNILDNKMYAVVCTVNIESATKSSICAQVRSVAMSVDKKSLLLGTYGSEIYQIVTSDPKIQKTTTYGAAKELMKGHYTPNQKWTNEIWGLAVYHLDADKWATVSDDATLRVWSKSTRKQIQAIRLNTDEAGKELPPDAETGDLQDQAKARCLDICQQDRLLVVGFKEGTMRVYDAKNLKFQKLIKDRKRWISIIKFSPDNKMLAVGSHDDIIDLYSSPDFKLKYSMKKHSSFITHLDWSENSSNLQSNCGAYELLFWDVGSGKQMTGGATALKDEAWATWTCTLGWPVQGIWPPCASGKDINYVDRGNDKSLGYKMLCTADDWGKVNVFRYPCLTKGSEPVVGKGHSSHVTNVRWSLKDNFIFSCGGEDNCVFQWKVTPKK